MENIDFNNKKVLVRVDFNVPLSSTFQITDDNIITKKIDSNNCCCHDKKYLKKFT